MERMKMERGKAPTWKKAAALLVLLSALGAGVVAQDNDAGTLSVGTQSSQPSGGGSAAGTRGSQPSGGSAAAGTRASQPSGGSPAAGTRSSQPSGGSPAAGTVSAGTRAAAGSASAQSKPANNGRGGEKGTSALNEVKPPVKDADLVIPLADIGANAVFYPVDVSGTRLEVIAVRAPDGSVRTAFNTCQVCYGSGRGFYKQQGTVLVCQNCGNRFRMSQVGQKAGGCNPVPITESDRKTGDDTVTVPLSFLSRAKAVFANWKRS